MDRNKKINLIANIVSILACCFIVLIISLQVEKSYKKSISKNKQVKEYVSQKLVTQAEVSSEDFRNVEETSADVMVLNVSSPKFNYQLIICKEYITIINGSTGATTQVATGGNTK